PRHGPEPHAPASDPHGDGACLPVRGGRGPKREGQGPPVGSRSGSGGGGSRRREGSVRTGVRGGAQGSRLPGGEGGASGLDDRNLRRDEAQGGQLEMGRSSVLSA